MSETFAVRGEDAPGTLEEFDGLPQIDPRVLTIFLGQHDGAGDKPTRVAMWIIGSFSCLESSQLFSTLVTGDLRTHVILVLSQRLERGREFGQGKNGVSRENIRDLLRRSLNERDRRHLPPAHAEPVERRDFFQFFRKPIRNLVFGHVNPLEGLGFPDESQSRQALFIQDGITGYGAPNTTNAAQV
jgi:hypothetical protein